MSKKFKIAEKIKNGAIGVLPTDTIYGLVGSALSKKSVKRIYELRRRNPKKPMIILISSLKDLKIFKIKLNKKLKKILERFWPGKVSIILPCPHKEFSYLHRGSQNLAFRLPNDKKLIKLIKKTGPLVAPSVNPERFPPAKTIKEARKYFLNKADFYVNAGKLIGKPSTLIQIAKKGRNYNILLKREGAVKITSEEKIKC